MGIKLDDMTSFFFSYPRGTWKQNIHTRTYTSRKNSNYVSISISTGIHKSILVNWFSACARNSAMLNAHSNVIRVGRQ